MSIQRMLLVMIAVMGMFGSDAFAIYAPSTVRFMQRDPIGYVDGSNLYQYVRSNPLRYVDRNGWQATEPGSEEGASPSRDERLNEAMNPRKGCGVKVRRNIDTSGGGGSINAAHQWIEFWEFTTNDGMWLRGIGYWPKKGGGKWYTGGDPENSSGTNSTTNSDGITIVPRNDPHTGSPGDVVWDTTRTDISGGKKKLEHGIFAGRSCKDASCEMIRECLRKSQPSKPWKAGTNDCRGASGDALSDCCLTTVPTKGQ